ncbi:cobalamin biosynthesis protein [Pseudomonas sp. R5(2019)]|uniref:cobalamin biosynthesis protein n=1 Tax=Pseudomonas sp. R5(2019) TaxID=2697566 RepID=UPI001412C833|nr:cobalamin biosynthesis protein [Pseudomonas sp. R5(2019)]NBA97427.1 cobalamin biosynthesis protein CobE [Pseudomonas sp. R5(2019)]
MQPQVVAGLGCQRGCPADALGNLLEQALKAAGLTPANLAGLASIDLKREEPGLLALARQLDVPLFFFSADQLNAFEPMLSHRSAIAFARTGCHGVAESAALALARQCFGTPPRLIGARQKITQATVALASLAQSR